MDEIINLATVGSGFVGGAAGAAVWAARMESRVKAVEQAMKRIEEVLALITVIQVKEPGQRD